MDRKFIMSMKLFRKPVISLLLICFCNIQTTEAAVATTLTTTSTTVTKILLTSLVPLSQYGVSVAAATTLKQVRLGVPIPWSGTNWDAGPRFASGITIAVDKINADPTLLPGYNVSFVWGDSKCDEKASIGVMTDMLKNDQFPVNALIGPACSDGCRSGSFLSDHLKVGIQYNIPYRTEL